MPIRILAAQFAMNEGAWLPFVICVGVFSVSASVTAIPFVSLIRKAAKRREQKSLVEAKTRSEPDLESFQSASTKVSVP